MQDFSLKKTGIIAALIIVMLIALEMVSGIVRERTHFRNSAKQNIAQSWTGKQKLVGPIMVIPYTKTIVNLMWDEKAKKEVSHIRQVQHTLFCLPEQLQIKADISTELRYRGMYAVPVYAAQLQLKGKFNKQKLIQHLSNNDQVSSIGKPYIVLNINDIRGIPERPQFNWNEQSLDFDSGSALPGAPSGMHVKLPDIQIDDTANDYFDFSFTLRGMESLSFAATGINTMVQVQSSWPHPSFTGRYLPEQRRISKDGFRASWRISSFSSGIEQLLEQCRIGQCQPLQANTFGVTLMQTVDIYQQAERSMKYGILFITLTFTAIIVFELLKKLAIHPLQYFLVGAALVIFYLLLVSLSEHIPFHWAYFSAALACTGLLCFYLTGVMQSTKQGLYFSSLIGLLYGILYIILRAEDYALLMGCLLLFLVLSVLMTVTRRIGGHMHNRLES